MAKKAVLFDLDGTLVQSWTTNILSGVLEVINTLKTANMKLGICTNQAGPLWRFITNDTKYPTIEKLAENFVIIAESLGLKDATWLISVSDERLQKSKHYSLATLQIHRTLTDAMRSTIYKTFVSFDPSWRKPQPYVLWFACDEMGIDTRQAVYVGDMASDEKAAQLAGIDFVWAKDISKLPEMIGGMK